MYGFFSFLEVQTVTGEYIVDIDYTIKCIILYQNFKPSDFRGLFLDRDDYEGLLYWYDICLVEMKRAYKESKNKK